MLRCRYAAPGHQIALLCIVSYMMANLSRWTYWVGEEVLDSCVVPWRRRLAVRREVKSSRYYSRTGVRKRQEIVCSAQGLAAKLAAADDAADKGDTATSCFLNLAVMHIACYPTWDVVLPYNVDVAVGSLPVNNPRLPGCTLDVERECDDLDLTGCQRNVQPIERSVMVRES